MDDMSMNAELLNDDKDNCENKPKNKKSLKKEILSWVWAILAGVAAALIIIFFIIVNATVPTGSMINTINEKDRIMAFRLSYAFSDPVRGDIVIFDPPIEDEEDYYVKRIIGLPGDTIEGKGGDVYINGELLKEDYIKVKMNSDFGPYIVPEESYFMMGDNRNDSKDSRFWDVKFVNKSAILGRVFIRYFPNITIIDQVDYSE